MKSEGRSKAGLWVGTAGWDYPDWRGNFFPDRLPRGVHALTYVARYFDTVEVNSTFYRPTRPEYAQRWLACVEAAPRFSFTVKLWQRFTHEREHPPGRSDVDLFREGIQPLVEAGRLGGVLVQFPWSFKNEAANRSWLEKVLDFFADYPLALEVRHASWNVAETYEYLSRRRVAICNIDQPLYRNSIAPDERITARVGYVRLHGQNFANWFREDAGRDARYDYLYSEEELTPWVEKIERMRRLTKRLYVITNNHFRGQAAANGLQLKHRLSGEKVKVPEPLVKAFPQLGSIREGGPPGTQEKLF
jgi:uncharacterized protein YecE (DUF72 family)